MGRDPDKAPASVDLDPHARIEDACACLLQACSESSMPAAGDVLGFVPAEYEEGTRNHRLALIDLVGVHLRARLQQDNAVDLSDYLSLAEGDQETQDEIRTLFRNTAGPFQRELDVQVLSVLHAADLNGNSVVYAARDRAADGDAGADVVVKVLHPNLRDDAPSRERFRQEVELLKRARGHTDNVVRIYEAGNFTHSPDGIVRCPAYVMEHCDGSLTSRMANYRGETAVAIVERIASAVSRLHAVGIVLRDLKPANILLRRSEQGEEPVLADLGMAKDLRVQPHLTEPGQVPRGTPGYRSPEAVQGQLARSDASEQADDVYGLGAILYQLLHPGHRDLADREAELTNAERVRQIVAQGLADADAKLRVLVQDCLAPRAADRPTMGDVAERLRLLKVGRNPGHLAAAGRSSRWRLSALALVPLAIFAVAIGWPSSPSAPKKALPALHEIRLEPSSIDLVYAIDPTVRAESLNVILQEHLDADTSTAFDRAEVPLEIRAALLRQRRQVSNIDERNDLVAYRYPRDLPPVSGE